MRPQRTARSFQSCSMTFHSPPTYRAGLETPRRSGSMLMVGIVGLAVAHRNRSERWFHATRGQPAAVRVLGGDWSGERGSRGDGWGTAGVCCR